MDYRKLAQEVVLLIKQMYRINSDMHDVLDTVKCAIAKYNIDIDDIALNIADVDHKKIIWQILIDLRFARGTDYDYDIELYRNDTAALQEITTFLEKNTDDFNREGSTVIDISAINRQAYLELIKEYELR